MRVRAIIVIASALAGLAAPAEARLVSYPGGWTVMGAVEGDMAMVNVHYTVERNLAVGWIAEWDRAEDWSFQGVQANVLIHRINLPAAQVNLYARGAAGAVIDFDGAEDSAGAMAGITFDAEDRRYFFKYENMAMIGGERATDFRQMVRVGIAPYLGAFGDLHTWVMLQADHRPEADAPLTLTPILRFFKGPYLAEFGVSDRGEPHFHLEIRF